MEILVKDEMKTLLGWGIQIFIHDTDTVVCSCYFPLDKKSSLDHTISCYVNDGKHFRVISVYK